MSLAAAPVAPPATVASVAAKDEEVVAGAGTGRLKKMLMIGILVAGLACLFYWWSNHQKEKMQGDGGEPPATIMGTLTSVVGGILGFNRSGDPVMQDENKAAVQKQLSAGPVHHESKSAMADIAAAAKAAGLKLQGVSQCKWTQHQREMFGGRDDAARKDIESIYTECRSREMCPNIKGYPTWLHGDRHYPGFKSPSALKALIREVENTQTIPSLQGPSEPIEENIPAAVPSLASAAAPVDPEMMYEMMKRMMEKKEADALATRESNKNQDGGGAEGGGASLGEAGGAGPGVKCADTTPPVAPMAAPMAAQQKENVRGVSFHAPLNVPDMPGTAPFVLNTSFADDQTRQGNAPRMAADSRLGTPQLAQQVVSTFNQAQTHEATRSSAAQVFSQAKLPHSADITTGEAFDDKTVFMAKN
jgi:hypothetical protein